MPFVALRVPIALLHQKVYPTGHRLERFEKKAFEPKSKKDDERVTNIVRVISSVASDKPPLTILERVPHIRKYFLLMGDADPEEVMCRGCGVVCGDVTERNPHFKKCFGRIKVAVDACVKDGKCVICDTPLNKVKLEVDFYGAPVCSENCMHIWDYFSPEIFEEYLKQGKGE